MTNYPAPPPVGDGNDTAAKANLPRCETPHCSSTSAPRLVLVFAGDNGPSRAWMCDRCERIAAESGSVVARLSRRYVRAEVDAMRDRIDEQRELWPSGF